MVLTCPAALKARISFFPAETAQNQRGEGTGVGMGVSVAVAATSVSVGAMKGVRVCVENRLISGVEVEGSDVATGTTQAVNRIEIMNRKARGRRIGFPSGLSV